MLIAYPILGLANRLRALASIERVARRLGRDLVLCWVPSPTCGCRFEDLFENRFARIDRAGLRALGRVETMEDYWDPRINFLNMIQSCIGHSYLPDPLLLRTCNFVAFTDESTDVHALSPDFVQDVSAFHRGLRPVPEVRRRVAEFADRHLTPATIGVHLRRTDNTESRTVSTDERFLGRMVQLVERDSDTRFFLATDCPDARQMVFDRFGDRTCELPKRTPLVATDDVAPCRGTREGVQDGLCDLLLLSRTHRVLGSHNSSFSWAASYFSGRCDQVTIVE